MAAKSVVRTPSRTCVRIGLLNVVQWLQLVTFGFGFMVPPKATIDVPEFAVPKYGFTVFSYLVDNDKEEHKLGCFGENDGLRKSTQLYQWTYANGQPLGNNDGFKVDSDKISFTELPTSMRVVCTAVQQDESRKEFTYDIVGIKLPRYARLTELTHNGRSTSSMIATGMAQGWLDFQEKQVREVLIVLCDDYKIRECPYHYWIDNIDNTTMVQRILMYVEKVWRPPSTCQDVSCVRKYAYNAIAEMTDYAEPYFAEFMRQNGGEDFSTTARIVAVCDKGYNTITNNMCVPCYPGTYGAARLDWNRTTSRSCETCPSLYFQGLFSQTACDRCPYGSIHNEAHTSCIERENRAEKIEGFQGPRGYMLGDLMAGTNFDEIVKNAEQVTGYFGLSLTTAPASMQRQVEDVVGGMAALDFKNKHTLAITGAVVGGVIVLILLIRQLIYRKKQKMAGQQDMKEAIMDIEQQKSMIKANMYESGLMSWKQM